MRCLKYCYAGLITCSGRYSCFSPKSKGIFVQSNPILLRHKSIDANYHPVLEDCRTWVFYIELNCKCFSISSTFCELSAPDSCHQESLCQTVSVTILALKFLIFHAACWDNLSKGYRVTTVITILNFLT